MIFSKNKEEKKTYATITNGTLVEEYDCSFFACDNPVCSCGTLSIYFSPAKNECPLGHQLSSHTIEIDIVERKLGFKDKKKVSRKDLAFAELVLSQLGEDDFQLLYQRHFEYKKRITENADLESIDAYFDYQKVEQNGLMSAYNEVLPYGDQMQIRIDEKECIVLDQWLFSRICG